MRDGILFDEEHIYDFVERQKAALKEAFARLADEEALSKEAVDRLKQRFSLQVPTLKPDQWTADERANEVLIYVPFDGDALGFKIAPSASNGTVAVGEVVGKEVLLRIGSGLGLNVAEAAKREIVLLSRFDDWYGYQEACLIHLHSQRSIPNRIESRRGAGPSRSCSDRALVMTQQLELRC